MDRFCRLLVDRDDLSILGVSVDVDEDKLGAGAGGFRLFATRASGVGRLELASNKEDIISPILDSDSVSDWCRLDLFLLESSVSRSSIGQLFDSQYSAHFDSGVGIIVLLPGVLEGVPKEWVFRRSYHGDILPGLFG